jgi:prevent-host-death family protein
MKTIEINDASSPLAQYVPGARKEPLVVVKNGKPVVAIFSVDGMDQESLSLSTNPEFLGMLERSRERYRVEGGLSTDEVRRRLGLPLVKKKRSKK